MRERINRLAKGIVDGEMPEVTITPPVIEDVVRSGAAARHEFIVTSENHLHIKGLVYSSNYRVKPAGGAFGGTYNHVVYEVDGSFLEDGDEIKGSFYLVTNGGEREVPYSFRVELGTSGKALSDLKTAKDFSEIAKKDWETALRLFEYRDFTEAPFMKDLHVRALYDGLTGRPDRQKELEEFLTGLGAKEAVTLTTDTGERKYERLSSITEDVLEIKRNGWGYVNLDVRADCDFLEIPKRNMGENDFQDDVLKINYRIHPERLHGGRNYGRILVNGGDKEFVFPITTVMSEGAVSAEETYAGKSWMKYLRLCLDEAGGQYEIAFLHNQKLKALEEIEAMKGSQCLLKLLRAEIYAGDERSPQAALLLDECGDQVLAEREQKLERYCYYQYLRLLLEPDVYQKESLLRLLHKYIEENPRLHWFLFLLLKTDTELSKNPEEEWTLLKRQFDNGCRSPFLYTEALNLFNREPDFIRGIGLFELLALHYGAGHGLIGGDLAEKIAGLTLTARHFNALHYRMLVKLYENRPEKEVLEAVCSMLIKGERRGADAFSWYEKGIKEGISLTRLYEYYLYSLPKDYHFLLPKEVLLYFSYGENELDRHSKSVLYKNVLVYLKPDDPLYQAYERDMEQFATKQLLESRINSRLAVIYKHMIFKDVIDVPMAKVLPSILRSCRVECKDRRMKYAVVCYEEMTVEDAFLLEDGVAYVPLFSGHSILLFQDAFGNRFSRVSYRKTPVMNEPELEKKCFELYPSHPMLRLAACGEILDKGVKTAREAELLEEILEDPGIHPLYHKILLSRVIEYYQDIPEQEKTGESGSYLIRLDKRGLTKDERLGICETLIDQSYMEEAFNMIREFGCEGIAPKRLLKLCTKMILQSLFGQDRLLLSLAWQAFSEGMNDSVIMDYLCEHFNGTTDQMYQVLMGGISGHVETYDLEERLVAQMMFSDCTERIDKVFRLYMTKKKTSENIVRAYFTIKSTEYFMEDKTPDDTVFAYLEGAVNGSVDKDRIPTIYLLALTKYYSTLPSLDGEQEMLCRTTVNVLLEEGLVFPYFKELARYAPMPGDIMDKAMVQYSTGKNARVELKVRILPDEEEFHSEDIRRIYQGIFVKQKVLFEGEIMEYQIRELENGEWILKKEGSIGCDAASSLKDSDSRFACLNEMSLCLSLKDEEGLKKRMQEYLEKNAAAETLFPLM